MQKFSRNIKLIISLLVCVIIIITLIFHAKIFVRYEKAEYKYLISWIKHVVISAVSILMAISLPPQDFHYQIEDRENYLIFYFSESDVIAIKKPYQVTRKRRKMRIYDGTVILEVPYSGEVREFLKKDEIV